MTPAPARSPSTAAAHVQPRGYQPTARRATEHCFAEIFGARAGGAGWVRCRTPAGVRDGHVQARQTGAGANRFRGAAVMKWLASRPKAGE